MNFMGMLQNHNSNLFVVEWWPWPSILHDNGEPKDFPLITTAIAGWMVSGDDECCRNRAQEAK
jgi:hypothetical protein